MFRFFALLLLVAVGLAKTLPAAAETLEHLYEVRVAVADQSDEERRKVLGPGLRAVLVRATGLSTAELAEPVLQAAYQNPDVLLQEFRYAPLDVTDNQVIIPPAVPAPAGAPAPAPPSLMIQASFSPVAIRELLRKANLPLWPRNRPTVLGWLLVEKGPGTRMMLFPDELKAEALRRGLPLVVPQGDAQDKQLLVSDAGWMFDPATLAQAGERYGIDTLLVGHLSPGDNGGWKGSWYFVSKGQAETRDVEVPSTDAFLATGIDVAIHKLLTFYAVVPTDTPQIASLQISGIANFSAYSRVLKFLRQIEIVRSVDVAELDHQTLQVKVHYEGDVAVFRELVSLGGILQADSQGATAAADAPLGFKLVIP